MKHFAFVISALAVGLAAATPARADYAVVRWADGYCHLVGRQRHAVGRRLDQDRDHARLVDGSRSDGCSDPDQNLQVNKTRKE
jgi:hypothetical protein